jgi:hypothetical protein
MDEKSQSFFVGEVATFLLPSAAIKTPELYFI